jgi:predicted nucleic acid-binding protein
MYLLDTQIVAELRRAHPHDAVLTWLHTVHDSDLYLSAFTIAELQAGVELTRDRDPDMAAATEAWIDQIAETFNILAMDARVFRAWARLLHRRSDGMIEDAMIAATALANNLTVVTGHVEGFEALGVPTLNPFEV